LFDGILIKDNHLALGGAADGGQHYSPAEAVARARQFLTDLASGDPRPDLLVEVEVDTLGQLREVLPARPDIVLLDNMPPDVLRQAVALRDSLAPGVELEASGGINLQTIRAVANSGVDRISAGALTHSAAWFDLGLDWKP
jgi:nicotinate-nucleotide pyrophosphorylase (carboxylating)